MEHKITPVGFAACHTTANFVSLLSNEEAAEYIGVRKETLDAWRCIGRYQIPHIKVGRLVKYRKSDLDAWLESRRVACAEEVGHA